MSHGYCNTCGLLTRVTTAAYAAGAPMCSCDKNSKYKNYRGTPAGATMMLTEDELRRRRDLITNNKK